MSVARLSPRTCGVLTVVGNRPQFIKAAAVSHRLRDGARRGARPHGPALRRGALPGLLRRARAPAPRAPARPRRRLQHRPDGAHAGGARDAAGRRAPRPGPGLRRHELDAGGRAGRRAGRRAGLARRGRHALVRPRDAGGAQPRAHRPRRVAAAVLVRGGRREPARRAGRRADRGGGRRDGRRRAAAGPARRRARRRARRARRRAGRVRARDRAPGGQRRRPGAPGAAGGADRGAAATAPSSPSTRGRARGSRPRGCSTGCR